MRHRVCETCGTYNDRQVIDVEARDAKKQARAEKKARARGLDPAEAAAADTADTQEAPKETEEETEKK